MKIIGIIPARGGSKGIPKKNLVKILDKSLLHYAINSAKRSHYIDKFYVSTDDEEISLAAKELNSSVIERPIELASDTSKSIDVIRHAIDFLEKEQSIYPDILVLIQPTTPFRDSSDIDKAIEIIKKENCDSVVSVAQTPSHFNFEWQLKINSNGFLKKIDDSDLSKIITQRQKLTNTYFRNGAVYVCKVDVIKKHNNIYGSNSVPYVMSLKKSINIDSFDDLELAKFYATKIFASKS